MAPTGGHPDWLPLAGPGEFPADAGGLLQRQSQMWIDGLGASNLDPRRIEMRNTPITHERDHNVFTTWARFFEDGIDNYHNPGNRSNYCSSWAFVQGGSPYDRCTKTAW